MPSARAPRRRDPNPLSGRLAASMILGDELLVAARVLNETGAGWAVAGGWAIDLFLDRATRPHADVDIAVWRDEQRQLRAGFPSGWQFEIVEDGRFRSWTADEWLALPIHELQATSGTVRIELLLNDRDERDWIYRRDPAHRRPLERAVLSNDTIPFLAPEIVLLYKSKDPRATDDADFDAALSALSSEQRHWLHDAIATAVPTHAWLKRLGPD